jgi:hypothetical protein
MRSWLAALGLGLLSCSSEHHAPGGTAGGAGGEGGAAASACDRDEDGREAVLCGGDDCDDERADIHPGATDICDGDDNDCDGVADQDDACDCAEPPPEPTVEFSARACLPGGWLDMGMGVTDPQAADISFFAGACEIEPPLTSASTPWAREEASTDDQLDRPFGGPQGTAPRHSAPGQAVGCPARRSGSAQPLASRKHR